MRWHRTTALAILAIGSIAMASPNRPEPVQAECGISSGFYVHLEEYSAKGERIGGPYILTFGSTGPGFGLPDAKYAPDWADVESIVFNYMPDLKTGRLSLNMRQHGKAFVQRVGIIKDDCWKLGKKWLKNNFIEVPIQESVQSGS